MDGFKRRLKESVQFRLSFTLALVILVVAGAAGGFAYLSAYGEAQELQDALLREVAQLTHHQRLSPRQAPTTAAERGDDDEQSRIFVQWLTSAQGAPPGNAAPLPLPATLGDGFHTVTVRGRIFRVLVTTPAQGQRIAVAQDAGFRDDLARDAALRTLAPLLLLVPLLLVIVAHLVRTMFRPITRLAQEVDARDAEPLRPIEQTDLPLEVRPFVEAINGLLERVRQTLETQRRFVADAAHELRSPLSALILQAERLAAAPMSDEARSRLERLHLGLMRSRNLINQLLTLARVQTDTPPAERRPLAAVQLYRRVLEELFPMAEAKGIDIGVDADAAVLVVVNETDLFILIRNLVDNAIRYTPQGGRIDLCARADGKQVILRILDNGPGIPPEQRERVFDPFYRMAGSEGIGSGLGLSIVRAIAERMGARIELDWRDPAEQTGLAVTLVLPGPPAAPS